MAKIVIILKQKGFSKSPIVTNDDLYDLKSAGSTLYFPSANVHTCSYTGILGTDKQTL